MTRTTLITPLPPFNLVRVTVSGRLRETVSRQTVLQGQTWEDEHMKLGSGGRQALLAHVLEAEALCPRHYGLLGRRQADGRHPKQCKVPAQRFETLSIALQRL